MNALIKRSLPWLALLLAGCGGQHQDLRAWMSEQRAQLHPHVQPI